MRPHSLKVCIWMVLVFIMLSATAWSQSAFKLKSAKKHKAVKAEETLSLPEHLNAENIDHIIAGLSDEQVRRLLINELKAQSRREARAEAGKAKPTGIAAFIDKIKNLTALLQSRIEYFRSGRAAAAQGIVPQEAAGIYAFLGKGERGTKTVASVLLSVAAVLAASLLIEWLFVMYTAAARRRLESAPSGNWRTKIGGLITRALLDFAAIVVFIIGALVIYYLFLDRTAGQRVVLATYLAVFVIVQAAVLVSRFFMAPRAPALRFLPFSDDAALYLHRWLIALTAVISFGILTSGGLRLAGASELRDLQASILVGLVAAAMLIWMILQKRRDVAAAFSQGLEQASLRYRLAQKWHHFAVAAVIVLVVFSVINRILGFEAGRATLTLLMVPLYFLMDWILRSILGAAFGIVQENKAQSLPAEVSAAEPEGGDVSETAGPDADQPSEARPALKGHLELDRMKGPLRAALRIALAALLLIWILNIWGVSLPVGETVVNAVLKILTIVLICYVAWGLINAAIMRRMRQELPEAEDEEAEEGGAGGSRIATLLLLLRKFMLVVIIVMAVLIVLSALGVNIGPLIAGAGVFGLAIGFGAQTLVKDIISGVFFLMDDAFRVGDYLECSGTKGTVEHISLRSLRLRNPRGQVYFIPFGDIKLVTNLSRDYVIMKLDFRVRYDADVEKIRKIIKKKVHNVIAADPELGPKLMEPIKSQGVREMDDSAMIMRVKYKTKPGDQFAIRKEVYHLMQEAFKQEGIEFAHRNVTVYMPPGNGGKATAQPEGDSGQADDGRDKGDIQRQAAAAAALAAIQAEEEKLAKAKQKAEK
jgi:small-conductance mechanosensitive channel